MYLWYLHLKWGCWGRIDHAISGHLGHSAPKTTIVRLVLFGVQLTAWYTQDSSCGMSDTLCHGDWELLWALYLDALPQKVQEGLAAVILTEGPANVCINYKPTTCQNIRMCEAGLVSHIPRPFPQTELSCATWSLHLKKGSGHTWIYETRMACLPYEGSGTSRHAYIWLQVLVGWPHSPA